jgi:hypothetical protein
MTHQANKHRRDIHYAVGDLAWLRTDNLVLPRGLTRKFANKWIGPFKIVKVVNPVAMELDLPKELRLHKVLHVSNLKPHHGQMVESESPVFKTDDDELYEVENILSHRVSRGIL